MPAKSTLRIVAIVTAIAAAVSGLSVLGRMAERRALTGVQHLLAGDQTRCGNLAVVAEEHLREFERRYKLSQRVFGNGLGHCIASMPDVRYTFVGNYRPNETRRQYVERIAQSLRFDGWEAPASYPAPDGSWTIAGPNGTELSLYITSGLGVLRNKPELVDLAVSGSAPYDRAERGPLPEYGGPYSAASLDQMIVFYPKPVPRGMARDASLDIDAIDYTLAIFYFTSDRGHEVKIDERPAPTLVTQPCDALGIVYRNAIARHPVCSRVATTADDIPVYAMTLPNREFHGSTYYGLIRDDTCLVLGRAKIRTEPFALDEVMKLVNALEPTNSESTKF